MQIVIAPDSFKESLTALEVANAIEQGFKLIFPDADYIKIPMADGGEGTVQSLIDALAGKLIETEVTAPRGNLVKSTWGISGDQKTAVIEMASASGLHLVPLSQRNPLLTTSFGTGELIKAALDLGVEKILLGIGGSATNDGGAGMLQSLGAKLLDAEKMPISFGAKGLATLEHIDVSSLDPRLAKVDIAVACDVDNPLCGEQGAAAIFAPQKGATPAMIPILDQALQHFATVVQRDIGLSIAEKKGAGGAGGMGGGLLLLPNVQLKSGVKMVMEAVNLEQFLPAADLVITGEGRMDSQSIQGKTPIGVAQAAKRYGKPVIALVGSLRQDYDVVYQYGIDAVFPIIPCLDSLETTLSRGQENLISTAQNVARLYRLSQ